MRFKAWARIVIKEDYEVSADSYTEALARARELSKSTKDHYNSNDQVIGIEYGVTPLSMEKEKDD